MPLDTILRGTFSRADQDEILKAIAEGRPPELPELTTWVVTDMRTMTHQSNGYDVMELSVTPWLPTIVEPPAEPPPPAAPVDREEEEIDLATVDVYAELNLTLDASDAAVRLAYRRRAREAHPDAKMGSHAAFIRVQHAFNTLSSEAAREAYDRAHGLRKSTLSPTATDQESMLSPAYESMLSPERQDAAARGAIDILTGLARLPDMTDAYLAGDLHPADDDGPAWTEDLIIHTTRTHPRHGDFTEAFGVSMTLLEEADTSMKIRKYVVFGSKDRYEAAIYAKEHPDEAAEFTEPAPDED